MGGVATAAVSRRPIQTTDLYMDYLKHSPAPRFPKTKNNKTQNRSFLSPLLPYSQAQSQLYLEATGTAFHLK